MKVLLLAWSIVLLLHCTTAEENTEAKLAERTITESEDNLLTDLKDALDVQTRDEPDGDDKIEAVDGGADENGGSEDENQVRDLAMKVRGLLKQDGEADIPGGKDTGVVESLKRKLEDMAAGDRDEREGPADKDGTEGSLDRQARCIRPVTQCKIYRPFNWDMCCPGNRCYYFFGSYVCGRCGRRSEKCHYGTSTNMCCKNLVCKRQRKQFCNNGWWASRCKFQNIDTCG